MLVDQIIARKNAVDDLVSDKDVGPACAQSPPAPEVLKEFCDRFKTTLPPSFIELLSIYNGIANFDHFNFSIYGMETHLQSQPLDVEWADSDHFEKDELFIFGGSYGLDSSRVAFLLKSRRADGEMKVLDFDAKRPIWEFESFKDYLQGRLEWYNTYLAEEKAKVEKVKKRLIQTIESDFKNVPKGVIGIRQASAIDSRFNPGDLNEDMEKFNTACEQDRLEKEWQQIPFTVLASDPAVFSHMDAAGFKFILPAMMRWSLSENYNDRWDVIQSLQTALIAYDARGPTPQELVAKLELSAQQIKTLVDWFDATIPSDQLTLMSPYQLRSLKEWKLLTRKKSNEV